MTDNTSLKFLIEDDLGQQQPIEVPLGEIRIGRLPDNTIVLNERNVSRYHARLLCQGQTLLVEDLNSANGLWRNDQRIVEPVPLVKGDILRIGDFQLHVLNDLANERVIPEKLPILLEQTPTAAINQEAELQSDKNAVNNELNYARLVGISHHFRGRVFVLRSKSTMIGRIPSNEIVLEHRSVSREHAQLVETDNDNVKICDLNSANGVLVNGESYREAELFHGDIVHLGHIALRFAEKGQRYHFATQDQIFARQHYQKLWRSFAKVALVIAALSFAGYGLIKARSLPLLRLVKKKILPPPLTQAAHALHEHDWASAQRFIDQALAAVPQNPAALALQQRLQMERQAGLSLERANANIAKNHWSDAWNDLQEVPKTSDRSAIVEKLAVEVKNRLVLERLSECRAALHEGNFAAASLQLEEIEGLTPDRRDLGELRQKIADGRKKAQLEKPNQHSLAKHPANIDNGKANTAALAAAKSRHFYEQALIDLDANNLPRALEHIKACLQADKSTILCYRLMGIAYARSGDAAKAIFYYRRYLKMDPNGPEAPQIRRFINDYRQQQLSSQGHL